MAHENRGLVGIYEDERRAKAVASAPYGVERNSTEIRELTKRVTELENTVKWLLQK